MTNIIPCDDCGKPIEVGHLSKRSANEKFVCRKCRVKYDEAETMIAAIESMVSTVH